MKIPGGDLAPARRRRYGGSYGRRHRRNQRIAMGIGLVLVLGGTAYLLRRDEPSTAVLRTSPSPTCAPASPKPAPTAARLLVLPQPQQVRVTLLNGTSRNGLAKLVADQLAARGFAVPTQGNAPSALAGASTVSYGPAALPGATLVQHHVLGSRLVSNPRLARGSVTVTLGGDFRRLATPAEADAAAQVPAPTASASPRASCAA